VADDYLYVCVYAVLSPYFLLLLFRGTSLDMFKTIPFYLVFILFILYIIGVFKPNVCIDFKDKIT